MRRKRPNGKWQVWVYNPALKRKEYVGTREREREARELEREKEAEFSGRPADTGGLTVDRYAAEWLELHHGAGTPRPAASTYRHNEGALRAFRTTYGDRLMEGGIDRREALKWSKQHPHNAQVVSAMFNDAVNDMVCAANPFANRRQEQSRERKHIHPLTAEEIERLAGIALQHWGPDGYGRVARAWALFGAWVGCRPGETFGTELAHMDFEAGTVDIRRVKKRGGRHPVDTVVLPRAVVDAIRAMPSVPATGPIFRTTGGKRMEKGALRYYWDPIRAAFRATVTPERWAELLDGTEDGKNLDFYALRHFAASIIVARGGNEYDVAAQLGNSPQVARETYIHSYRDAANERNRRFLDGGTVVDLAAVREQRSTG